MPEVKPPEYTAEVKQPGRLELLVEQAPTKLPGLWKTIQRIDPLESALNRVLINKAINVLDPRPYRLSTRADWTTYETLTDKKRNTRQLPRRNGSGPELPDLDRVVELFRRDTPKECEKSTVLFAYIAQWFTDGFLRSTNRDVLDKARDITHNESTHEVDLAQLYGLNECELELLRDENDRTLLAAQGEVGRELPPDMYADGQLLPRFEKLRVIRPGGGSPVDDANLLAMGSDAANAQIGYAMLNTLFLREHNRIAREIRLAHGDWHPDRIFGAARSVLTVLLIRVVIEEYINHIHPYHFRFRLDPRGFDRQRWMRPNWVAVEFNLLYRWHSLIPDTLDVGGEQPVDLGETMYRAKPLLSDTGLATLIDRASRQPAGKLGLHNSPRLLMKAEMAAIAAGRTVELRGYNDYREACRLGRAEDFGDITKDAALAAELKNVYGHVDNLEYFVGLFAEDRRPNSVLPPLVGRLVGLHAFSQLMTNPLFAPQVYNTETFSRRGAEIIAETKSFADLVRRNIAADDEMPEVRLTRAGWKPK